MRRIRTGLVAAAAAAITAIMIFSGATMAFLTDSAEPLVNEFTKVSKYTLTYHANAGEDEVTVPETQKNFDEGKFDISDMIPERDGYVFKHWSLNEDGSGDEINPGDVYTTEELHTDVYAQWSAGYRLIYDANGGSNPPAADTHIGTEESFKFDIKGQEGMKGPGLSDYKVFLGWADSKDAMVPTYGFDGKYGYIEEDYEFWPENTKAIDGEITLQSDNRTKTLYAVWATQYKLIFDANEAYNGTGNVPAPQSKVSTNSQWDFKIPENNQDNNDPAITPKRTDSSKGYRFGWWSDDPHSRNDGPGTYQYGERVTVYDEAKQDGHQDPWKVLYAIYKPPKTLGLSFSGNGGSIQSNTYGTYWGSVLTDKQLVDIPDEPKDPTRSNYIFMGWSKDPNRKTSLIMSGDISERQKNGDYNPGDQILIDIWEDSAPTLYAVWRAKHNFRLQFNLNGGSVGYYKDDNGAWRTNTSTTGMYYETGYVNTKDEIVEEWTWPASHFETHGVYATRKDDETNAYKFLGWHSSDTTLSSAAAGALTAEDVDYPVTLPTDPMDPGGTAQGTEGCITKSVTIQDTDGEDCTTPRTHYKYMYAVWEKTPLHSFKIIFTNKNVPNNSNMTGVTIINKANNATFSESESASSSKPIISTKNNISSNYSVSGKILPKTSLPIADNPSAEWSVAELSTATMIPYATKASTSTERYEFIGWSYGREGKSAGELSAGDVDIRTDAEGCITAPITIDDPDPESCQGEVHYLLLFPVFKTIPQHTYNVYLIPNYSPITNSGYSRNMQFKGTNGNWYTISNSYRGITIKDINGKEFKNFNAGWLTSKNQGLDVDSWGDTSADRNWWHNNGNDKVAEDGIKVYCNKNSSASASAPEFKFLGWSYNRDNKEPDQLGVDDVDIPAKADGSITGNIILREADVADDGDHCTADQGYSHNIVLYGVWESDKAHQYTVIFSGVLDGSKIMAKASETAEFKAQSTKTMAKITDFEGNEVENIKVAWEYDSDAVKLSDDTEHKKVWTADDWAKVGVYAEKEKDAQYQYIFKGWSTNPYNKDPETLVESDVDVHMDADGKLIITSVTIEDRDIDNCPGNVKHYDVLYAVWEKEPIPATHTFTVKFDRNSSAIASTSTYYKYYDSASSTWKTSSDAKYGTYTTEEIEVADEKDHVFDAAYWRETAKGLSATKSNSGVNSFEFLGWSYGRDGVNPRNLTADDVDITLDEEGFIKDSITVKCDDDNCKGGKHEITLYAIWDPKPLTKTYTLNFDLNTKSGEADLAGNAPETMVGSEVYGATNPNAWVNSYTFELEKKKPYYKSMAFVGWGTSRNSMPGEYGHVYDDDTPELADTKRNLFGNYVMTASGNSNASVTLYAIWAYEYQLTYYANDGSSAPSMEHEYTNQTTHNYTLSENYPSRSGYTFLGWSDNSNGKELSQLDESDVDYYPNNPAFGNDKPKVKVVTADPSGTTKLSLYAVWKKNDGTNSVGTLEAMNNVLTEESTDIRNSNNSSDVVAEEQKEKKQETNKSTGENIQNEIVQEKQTETAEEESTVIVEEPSEEQNEEAAEEPSDMADVPARAEEE